MKFVVLRRLNETINFTAGGTPRLSSPTTKKTVQEKPAPKFLCSVVLVSYDLILEVVELTVVPHVTGLILKRDTEDLCFADDDINVSAVYLMGKIVNISE